MPARSKIKYLTQMQAKLETEMPTTMLLPKINVNLQKNRKAIRSKLVRKIRKNNTR